MNIDYSDQRTKMVDNQIRPTDVTSHRVLDAFLTVAREEFVPAKMRSLAYIDDDIELTTTDAGSAVRFLMEPSPLAKLVQLAEIDADDVVLEVGAGSGYVSAILSLLAGSVVAVEEDESLAEWASENMTRLGYDNVAIVTGALNAGFPSEGPFDVIFFSGAVEQLPDGFAAQLRDGGRLVVVEGEGNASRATLYRKENEIVSSQPAFNTSVRRLPGFSVTKEFVF